MRDVIISVLGSDGSSCKRSGKMLDESIKRPARQLISNLFGIGMAPAQFDVDGIFIVNDSSDARHGRVNQLLLFNKRPLLLFVRQRTGIRKE